MMMIVVMLGVIFLNVLQCVARPDKCINILKRPNKCRVKDVKGSLLQFFYALSFFSLVRMIGCKS